MGVDRERLAAAEDPVCEGGRAGRVAAGRLRRERTEEHDVPTLLEGSGLEIVRELLR